MKRIILAFLIFSVAGNAYAGGMLVCDDHGNICIRPGGINCTLIPPTHPCSPEEADELLADLQKNVELKVEMD